MKWKDSFHPYAMATILFWSLSYVFTRLALQHFSPPALGFLRYLVASCALLVIVLTTHMNLPDKKDAFWFICSGATGFFLYMLTFNKGSQTVTASTSSVVIATTPIITALLARILYKERLNVIQYLAITVSFAGVLILTVMSGGFTLNIGLLYLLGAALSLSVYNLLQRQLTKKYSSVQITAFGIFCGTIMLSVFAPSAIPMLKTAMPIQIFYILVLGVFSSALAYYSWAMAFSKAQNTSSVSNYMFVTPFLTTLLGLVITKDSVELSTIVGGSVIIAGLLVFHFGNRQNRKTNAAVHPTKYE